MRPAPWLRPYTWGLQRMPKLLLDTGLSGDLGPVSPKIEAAIVAAVRAVQSLRSALLRVGFEDEIATRDRLVEVVESVAAGLAESRVGLSVVRSARDELVAIRRGQPPPEAAGIMRESACHLAAELADDTRRKLLSIAKSVKALRGRWTPTRNHQYLTALDQALPEHETVNRVAMLVGAEKELATKGATANGGNVPAPIILNSQRAYARLKDLTGDYDGLLDRDTDQHVIKYRRVGRTVEVTFLNPAVHAYHQARFEKGEHLTERQRNTKRRKSAQ